MRKAANYALNRADIVELLGGVAQEGAANFPPSSPLYGHPVSYKFDLPKAKALLKEANCVPCKITLAISTSGSGQMQPLPMNELIKSQLEEAGFQVNLQVMDWNALLALARGGVRHGAERRRDQCQPRAAGPDQRHDPVHAEGAMVAGRRQLGPLLLRRRRDADHRGFQRVRRQQAPSGS